MNNHKIEIKQNRFFKAELIKFRQTTEEKKKKRMNY